MHYREYMKFTKISILFTFSVYLFNPILSPYIKSIGFDDLQLGIIFSLLPLSILFLQPFIGTLSDNVGRKRVIQLGIIAEIAAVSIYYLSSSMALIAFARILDAVSMTAVTIITIAKIEDSIGKGERGKYSGISLSLAHAGQISAPVIGGIAADLLFLKAPFLFSAVMLTVLLAYLSKCKERGRKREYSFGIVEEIREFLSFRDLRAMAIIGTCMHIAHPAMEVFLPLLIMQKFNLGYAFVGYAYFFLGATHLLQFYFGRISDNYKRYVMIVIGCLIYGLGMIAVAFADSYWLLAGVLFILGTGGSMWNVSAWSLMSDIGERIRKEGRIVSSYISIVKAGAFISFLLSGAIVTFFGIESLFMMSGMLILAGSVISLLVFRTKRCRNRI